MSFIKNQVEKFSKYLEKLKEQKAHFGAHTPPHILVEIDEIEEKIKELNKQIEKSERRQERFAQTTIDSSEAMMSLLDTLESIQIRIDNLDEQLQNAERRQKQFMQHEANNYAPVSNNILQGTISISISGMNHQVTIEVGISGSGRNFSISGMGERQTILIPNVSSIRVDISGMNNILYIPRKLLERVSAQKSGMNNSIIAI